MELDFGGEGFVDLSFLSEFGKVRNFRELMVLW